MKSKLWVFREFDPFHCAALAQALSISSATASLLLARGVTTPDEATSWMSHQFPHDPFLIPDMEQRLSDCTERCPSRSRSVFTATTMSTGCRRPALYLSFFGSLGANVRAYVPHRKREGYGLNPAAVQRLHDEGISLLVTSDCGTTSHHEIGLAKQLGMDVIVTDHHQTGEAMPPAVAVMNPHRAGAQYPFRGLCSAGLAYKVVQAYQLRYGEAGVPLESLLDLVALATIADVVPLQDENRRFVRAGARANLPRSALRDQGLEASGGSRAGLFARDDCVQTRSETQCRRTAGPCDVGCAAVDDRIAGRGAAVGRSVGGAQSRTAENRSRRRVGGCRGGERAGIAGRAGPGVPALACGRGGDRRGPSCGTVPSADDCHCHR